METVFKVVLSLFAAALALLFIPLISTAAGAFVGWVVGLFYDDTLKLLATRLGFDGVDPWQLGAMLGFVGGFFKASQTNSSSD